MPDMQSTAKFTADISQLRAQMQAAGRSVRLAAAEFKAATAGLDDWSSSADGLTAKLKQLSTTLEAQKSILEMRKSELAAVTAEYGENSAEADRARMAVLNQEAAIARTEREMRKYGEALSMVESETDGMADATNDAAESAAAASSGYTMLKGILADLASQAIQKAASAMVDLAKKTVETGSAFEAQMDKVSGIADAEASEINALTAAAKELGTSEQGMGHNSTEVAQAFEYMAMAGWGTKQMLDGVRGVLALAAAGQEDLATTSDIVTDALTAMGYAASDTGRLADVMATTASKSNTNIGLMGETYKYVAPIIGSLRYSMEDAAEAIGLLANAGIKGEKAGTILRSIMTRLAAPPKAAAEAIDSLDITITNTDGSMRSFSDVTDDLRAAMSGLSETEQLATAKAIAGQNAMSGLLAIVNAAPDDVGKLRDALANSAGAAERMASVMRGNLSSSIDDFKNAAQGLGIAAYDLISSPLSDAAQIATGAIRAVTDAITPEESTLRDYLSSVEASVDATSRTIDAVRKAVESGELDAARLETYKDILIETNGVQDEFLQYQLKTVVDELASSVPELAAAWDETTQSIRLTNAEIGALMDTQEAYVLQQSKTEALSAAMRAYADAQVDAAKAQSGFNRALKEAGDEAGREFATLEDAVKYYGQTGTAITDTYRRLMDASSQVRQSAQNIADAKGVYDDTKAALDEMGEAVTRTAEAADAAAPSVADLTEDIGELDEASNAAADAARDAADRIADAYKSAADAAEKAFSVDPFGEWAQNAENGIDKMQAALDSQIDGLTQYADNLSTVRSSLASTAPGFVSYLEDMGTAGAQLVKELAEAFSGGEGDAAKADKLISTYVEALNRRDEITSTIAADKAAIQAGLGELGSSTREWAQLESVISAIEDAGDELSSATADAFLDAASTAQAMGVAIPDGMLEGITSAEDGPEQAIKDAIGLIKGAIEGQAGELISIAAARGVSIPDSMADAISQGGSGAVDAYRQIIDAITQAGSGAASDAEAAGAAIASSTTRGVSQASSESQSASRVMSAAASDAASNFERAGVRIKAAAQAQTAAITSEGRRAASDMAQIGVATGASYASGVSSQSGAAYSAGYSLASSAASGASGVSGHSAGQNFAQGYVNGIASLVASARAQAAQLAAAASTSLNQAQQSHSPSRLTEKSGRFFAQGYIVGITNMVPALKRAVKSFAGSAVKSLIGTTAETAEAVGSAAVSRMADAISAKSTYMMDKLEYQNAQKIDSYSDKIDKLRAQQASMEDLTESRTAARVAALEDKRDAALERKREKNDAKIEKLREKRDAALESQQEKSDAKIAALREKRDATTDKAQKAAYKKQIDAAEKAAKKERTVLQKEWDAKIKAEEKAQKASLALIDDTWEKRIEKEKAAGDDAIKVIEEMYAKAISTQERLRDDYQEASSAMLKSLSSAMSDYTSAARDLVSSTMDGLTDDYDRAVDELTSKQDSLAGRLKAAGDLYRVSGAGVMTLGDLTAQTAQITAYGQKLMSIRAKVSDELFAEIADMDVREGSAYIDRLLAMDEAALKAYSDAYTSKMEAVRKASESVYKADFSAAYKTYQAAVKSAVSSLSTELEAMGQDALKGFVDGFAKNTDYMTDGVRSFVDQMISILRDKLQIHSPSRLTYGLGAYVGEGLADGIRSTVRDVSDAMSDIASAASSPIRALMPDVRGISAAIGSNSAPAGAYNSQPSQVVNNYNLVQNNSSPRALTALDTYTARREQLEMLRAMLPVT